MPALLDNWISSGGGGGDGAERDAEFEFGPLPTMAPSSPPGYTGASNSALPAGWWSDALSAATHASTDAKNNASKWECGEDGWVNGDIADYFYFMTIVLPTITLLGALLSSRMSASERDAAERAEGAHGSGVRIRWITASVITLLIAVAATVLPTVVFDGEKIAVHIRQVSPLLLCTLLVCVVLVTFGVERLASLSNQCMLLFKANNGAGHAKVKRGAGRGEKVAAPLSDRLLGEVVDEDDTDVAEELLKTATRPGGAGSINDDPAIPSSVQSSGSSPPPPPSLSASSSYETPLSALKMLQFWLLWLGMVTICASNVSTINLLSEIFTDRNVGSAVVASLAPVFVMLSSAILRLSGGWIITLVLHRYALVYTQYLLGCEVSQVSPGVFFFFVFFWGWGLKRREVPKGSLLGSVPLDSPISAHFGSIFQIMLTCVLPMIHTFFPCFFFWFNKAYPALLAVCKRSGQLSRAITVDGKLGWASICGLRCSRCVGRNVVVCFANCFWPSIWTEVLGRHLRDARLLWSDWGNHAIYGSAACNLQRTRGAWRNCVPRDCLLSAVSLGLRNCKLCWHARDNGCDSN